MSVLLYSTIDCDEHGIEVEKKVSWCEEYVEIATRQLGSDRRRTFRVACALVSAMMQHYNYDLNVLWKLLTDAVKYYDNIIMFSTQHIIFFPELEDSCGNTANMVYETTRSFENGDCWKIEFLSDALPPFDLEIRVHLTEHYYERPRIYRIEGPMLRPYFEKYCISDIDVRKVRQVRTSKATNPDFSSKQDEFDEEREKSSFIEKNLVKDDGSKTYVKETNKMLNAIAKELFYDSETDQLYITNIDLTRLEDFVDSTLRQKDQRAKMIAQFGDVEDAGSSRVTKDGEESNTSQAVAVKENQEQSLLEEDSIVSARDDLLGLSASLTVGEEGSFELASRTVTKADALGIEEQPPPLDKYEKYSSLLMGDETRSISSLVASSTASASTLASLPVNIVPSKDKRISFAGTVRKSFRIQDPQTDKIEPQQSIVESEDKPSIASKLSAGGGPLVIRTPRKSSAVYRNVQSKFHDFNFFSQDFRFEHYRLTRENLVKEDMDESVRHSYDSIKIARQEAMILSKNPLHEGARNFSFIPDEAKAFSVRQALSVRAEQRSAMSSRAIVDFLLSGCKLGRYLSHCSPYDCLAIADHAQLVDIDPPYDKMKVHYALGIEFGDMIANIFVMLAGQAEIERLDTLLLEIDDHEAFDEMDINAQWKYIYNNPALYSDPARNVFNKERLQLGDILGENVLNGEYGWTCHVRSLSPSEARSSSIEGQFQSSKVSLLQIPLFALQQFVGRKGADVEEAMVYFWKKTRLWNEISSYNKTVAHTSLYNSIQSSSSSASQSQKSTKRKAAAGATLSAMNVVESARLRIYQAGAEIFVQGHPRVYLYVIKQGSATYYRDFPKDLIGLDVIPERVETVQSSAHALPTMTHASNSDNERNGFGVVEDGTEHDGGLLLSHDFSFMDSEDESAIARIIDQDERFLRDFAHESEKLVEHRKRKYSRFLSHKNTLIANTRCEVIVVPLSEVGKSLVLFRGLMQLANLQFPMIMVNDEQVVREYHERIRWEVSEKSRLLGEVEKDKLSNRLMEEHWRSAQVAANCDDRFTRSPKLMLLSDNGDSKSNDHRAVSPTTTSPGRALTAAVSPSPRAPAMPKSSRSAARPVSGRGGARVANSSSSHAEHSSQTTTTRPASSVSSARKPITAPSSSSSNDAEVHLHYIDKYRSMLKAVTDKYEAENMEILRYLQKADTCSVKTYSTLRGTLSAVSSPTNVRSEEKHLLTEHRGSTQFEPMEGAALQWTMPHNEHRSLSPVSLTVDIPQRLQDNAASSSRPPTKSSPQRLTPSPRRGGIRVEVRNVHDLSLASATYRKSFSQSVDCDDILRETTTRPEEAHNPPVLLSPRSAAKTPEEQKIEQKERERQLFSAMLFNAQHGHGTDNFAAVLSNNSHATPRTPAAKKLGPEDFVEVSIKD